MASGYPGSLDSTTQFPNSVVDGTDAGDDTPGSSNVGFLAQWMRDVGDALIKIETELGTDPAGSFSDLKTRLNSMTTVRKSEDQTSTGTQTTLANVTDMAIPVTIGADHTFEFIIMYSSSATGTGIGFTVAVPSLNAGGYIAAETEVFGTTANVAIDTADALGNKAHSSFTTASGNNASASPGVVTANAVYMARVTGTLSNPSASGNIQLQWKSSTTANTTVKKGSFGRMYVN